MNHIPVPLDALMNLLQSQRPQPGQVQQAAPPGVAHMQMYPQIQMPTGGGPQAPFFAGYQPMQPGMAGPQHQFTAMPQQNFMQGHVPQVATSQMSMDDLRAVVAAAMQQGGPGATGTSGPPVGSHPSDEKTLVDALKKGREAGLLPRQSLERLHKVNGHTEMDWKNYFLEHLTRFYPMVYERRTEAPRPSVAQRGLSSSSSAQDPRSVHPKPCHSTSANGKARYAPGRRIRTPDDPSQSSSPEPIPVSARSAKAALARGPPISVAGNVRVNKSELICEHAGVQVPFLPPRVKPEPPQKPAIAPGADRLGKFTNEEKIFFIQFLRWRLEQKGPIPDRSELCEDLYVEAPHRSPSSWKKHWEIFPQLPDSILAEAQLRPAPRKSANANESRSAVLAAASSSEEEEGEEEEDEEEDEEEMDGDDADDDAPLDAEDTTSPPARTRKVKRKLMKVTDEDIRDMARYKLGRINEWDELKTLKARWKDFTSKNTKRSYGAWMLVANARHEAEIDKVVEELRKEQEREQHGLPHPLAAAPALPDTASSSASGRNSANAEQKSVRLQKRGTDSRLAVRSGSPVAKRVKQEPVEYISLLSDEEA